MRKIRQINTVLIALVSALAMQSAFSMDTKTDDAKKHDQDASVKVHSNHGKHHFHFGRYRFRGHGIKIRDFGARKHYKQLHN